VDLGHLLVGLAGDDRAASDELVLALGGLFAFGLLRPPHLPEPGERQRFAVGALDEVRLLGLLPRNLLPLVEAVGRDDAAALLEGVLVRVLLGEALLTSLAQNGIRPQWKVSRRRMPPLSTTTKTSLLGATL
jgi:hypothetical protein